MAGLRVRTSDGEKHDLVQDDLQALNVAIAEDEWLPTSRGDLVRASSVVFVFKPPDPPTQADLEAEEKRQKQREAEARREAAGFTGPGYKDLDG